jgi:hypothetical protein
VERGALAVERDIILYSVRNMRIPAPCVTCFLAGQPRRQAGEKVPIVMLPGRMTDQGIVLVECDQSHNTCIVYDARRYELLFQSASLALVDQHDREAVSGFAAALERAYEFYVRVVSRTYNLEPAIFDTMWKLVARQSERQFGCFAILYAPDCKKPPTVDNKQIEFRNNVIHRGAIPHSDDVYRFGEYVFKAKRDLETALQTKHASSLEAEIQHELAIRRSAVPKAMPSMSMKVIPVNVDTATHTAHELTRFEEYMAAMYKHRAECS